MTASPDFQYGEAFSRHLGWLADHEQEILRHKRIAIAGLGGVGGVHLLTLARLGIGNFSIADFDTFAIQNFNRQAGAMMSTLGQRKIDVMSAQALDINPQIDLRRFDQGVTDHNLAQFLDGVDLYLDGLDFFAFDARQAVFNAPKEMAVAPNGDIFVVDTENHAIRMIDASTWIVRTIAGNGTAGAGGDGGPAERASLARPHGAVVGPDGAIYIGDSENHRVRKLTRVA